MAGNLPDIPTFSTSGGATYHNATVGKYFVVDLDDPTKLAKTHILSVDSGGNLTLEFDKSPVNDKGPVLQSPNPVSPIYTTVKAGERIGIYSQPSINGMFSGRLTLLDHSRVTTTNDLYNTGGTWGSDGLGAQWTNNVIHAAGTDYTGLHGDFYQSYAEGAFDSTLGVNTKPWSYEISNNIYDFKRFPGWTATGVDVARDLFIYYIDGFQNANFNFHDNLLMGNLKAHPGSLDSD